MSKAIVTKESVIIFRNDVQIVVGSDHPGFQDIKAMILAVDPDWDAIVAKADIPTGLKKFSHGRITVMDDKVLYDGEVIGGGLTDKILSMMEEGHDFMPFILLMENLFQNPAEYVRKEFYDWMSTNRMPITVDGCFLAYKVVTKEFKDKHTKSFDNSVGTEHSMPRKDCNPDRNDHCSTGFHFCSHSYVKTFMSHGDRIVIVKVNPMDLTSFPADHTAKGRCCRYQVISESEATDTIPDKLEKKTVVQVDTPTNTTDSNKISGASRSGERRLDGDEWEQFKKELDSGADHKSLGQKFGLWTRTVERHVRRAAKENGI